MIKLEFRPSPSQGGSENPLSSGGGFISLCLKTVLQLCDGTDHQAASKMGSLIFHSHWSTDCSLASWDSKTDSTWETALYRWPPGDTWMCAKSAPHWALLSLLKWARTVMCCLLGWNPSCHMDTLLSPRLLPLSLMRSLTIRSLHLGFEYLEVPFSLQPWW